MSCVTIVCMYHYIHVLHDKEFLVRTKVTDDDPRIETF